MHNFKKMKKTGNEVRKSINWSRSWCDDQKSWKECHRVEVRFLVKRELKMSKWLKCDTWEKMCAQVKEKSIEEQSEVRAGLLGYC